MHHLKYHYATYCCNDTWYMRLKRKTVNLRPKLYTEKCPTKSPEEKLTFFSHPFESVTVLSKQLRSRLVCIYFSNFVIVLRQTRPLSTSFSSAWIFYNNHADSHNARCEAFHQSQVSLVSYTVINCIQSYGGLWNTDEVHCKILQVDVSALKFPSVFWYWWLGNR